MAKNILHSSKSVEWYTPEWVIAHARSVLGIIDLDPASSEEANKVVRANKFYTDGLERDWGTGTIWLNPPYGRATGRWVGRWLSLPPGQNRLLLVNAVPDRRWFRDLWNYPICWFYRRIKFWGPENKINSPTCGNALVYCGTEPERFAQYFGPHGRITDGKLFKLGR